MTSVVGLKTTMMSVVGLGIRGSVPLAARIAAPAIPSRVYRTLLFAILALNGANAYGQMGLGLSPMRLEFVLTPGLAQSGPLTVNNESAAPIRVRAEILDFYIDDQGTPQFAASYPAEVENSCRSWLSLNPMETEVPARSSVIVRYTLRVPQVATARGFHCAAGFTTLPAATEFNGTGLKTAIRMVAVFYAVVGQPAIEGELSTISMEYVKGDEPTWRAVVVVKNGGFKYFRALGELTVLDESGALIQTTPFPSLPVLPQRSQRLLIPLKNVSPDHKYTLRARVDFGASEIQEGVVTLLLPAAEK
jgi:hypothetical protein